MTRPPYVKLSETFDNIPERSGRAAQTGTEAMDATWVFKSVPHIRGAALAQLWKWQLRSTDGRTTESRDLFGTLNQCVRDAQQHGFLGEVNPADGTFTTSSYSISIAKDGSVMFLPAKRP